MSNLTDQQMQQVTRWLQKHWKQRAECPMCGTADWNVGDTIFEYRDYNKGDLVVGGMIAPVVCITCNHCGNMVTLSAVMLGLVAPPEK